MAKQQFITAAAAGSGSGATAGPATKTSPLQTSASPVVQVSAGRALDGRYRLDTEIGTGGLGVVYRATHEKLAKPVAVKLLHAHCGDDAVMLARFEREAKALAALDHPNIVQVTDYGVEDDTPYLVMELLEGQTKGARGSDALVANVRRYNREHASDVRGHLLLGSLYANREWRADALTQFQIAYQIDPSSRGAPEMLPTLIAMVARGSGAAIRFIESAYRGEALAAVNKAMRTHRDDSRALARLANLRARLTK